MTFMLEMPRQFDQIVIPLGGFCTIIADPPCKYGTWAKPTNRIGHDTPKPMPYPTMTARDIAALPVAQCAVSIWRVTTYRPTPTPQALLEVHDANRTRNLPVWRVRPCTSWFHRCAWLLPANVRISERRLGT